MFIFYNRNSLFDDIDTDLKVIILLLLKRVNGQNVFLFFFKRVVLSQFWLHLAPVKLWIGIQVALNLHAYNWLVNNSLVLPNDKLNNCAMQTDNTVKHSSSRCIVWHFLSTAFAIQRSIILTFGVVLYNNATRCRILILTFNDACVQTWSSGATGVLTLLF